MLDPSFDFDAVKGAFSAFALGNATGAPYGLFEDRNRSYSGGINLGPRNYNHRKRTFRDGVPGQITDVTEMLSATINAFIEYFSDINQKNYRESAIKYYMEWANSNPPFIGNYEKSLFQNVKSVGGYESRVSKNNINSDSNSSLIRTLPFVFIIDPLCYEFSEIDQELTNKNDHSKIVVSCYIGLIKILRESRFKDKKINPREIIQSWGFDASKYPLEGKALQDGYKKRAVYPLVYLIECLETYPLVSSSLEIIANELINFYRGCDSGAILSIVFGAYGAILGYEELMKSQWFVDQMKIVEKANPYKGQYPRPKKFFYNKILRSLEKFYDVLSTSI
jgi:hypothetical protein